jgi:hypothetical protein
MRQCSIGTRGDDGFERQAFETGSAQVHVNRQADLALGSSRRDFSENLPGGGGQEPRAFPERFELVIVLSEPRVFDDAVGRDEIERCGVCTQSCFQPAEPVDGEMVTLESDTHELPIAQHAAQGHVVRTIDDREVHPGTLVAGSTKAADGSLVPGVSQELDPIA